MEEIVSTKINESVRLLNSCYEQEHETNDFAETTGAWNRSEIPSETVAEIRSKFNLSLERKNDRAYIDSNVLIWHLRGNEIATEFLRKLKSLKEYELWIGAMQRAEIVFCMRTAEEKATELFLWQF